MNRRLSLALALGSLLAGPVIAGLPSTAIGTAAGEAPALPGLLSESGLLVPGSVQVQAQNLPFSPQYPLWSDGATKRRWLYLPPGTAINAARTEAWEFPPGTRLWKEFSHGRPVETRLIERLADGTWRYTAYIWDADGRDAVLAPPEGARVPVAGAPGGHYVIPSRDDCRACHEGTNVPVLGVSALQLSPDRDPGAPHAEPKLPGHLDLPALVERGLVRNLPPTLLDTPPRVAASSPTARAALGYLHANCGQCHNDRGPLADMALVLDHTSADAAAMEKVLGTIVDAPADTRAFGLATRIAPGRPGDSQLLARIRSRDQLTQMPPLASELVDNEGVALVEQWIQQLLIREDKRQ